MNYWASFGLEYNPFQKNNKQEVIIETSAYKETMARLNYLSAIKGFGLLTGSPGCGKTTTIRQWIKGMNPSQYKIIYMPLSTITTVEFYRNLAMELGIDPSFHKADNYRFIQAQINYLVLEKKITPIIILDEADSLNSSILCDLKMLFNFDTDSKDRAVILLVGLPVLNNILKRNSNESLKQRLVMNYNMEPVSKEEAEIYIKEKIKKAGGVEDIFTQQALNAITNSSAGIMRVIDKICNDALLIGDSQKAKQINGDLAMNIISDTELI